MKYEILDRLKEHIEFHESIDTHKADAAFLRIVSSEVEKLLSELEWIDVNMLTPENDTNVIGCCDDDVFECRHYDDGAFDDCGGEPIKVQFWKALPDSPYQSGQVKS